MASTPHVALDTETTGFSPKRGDRLFELAATRFDPETGRILDRFHEFVNPGRRMSPEAQRVHGVRDEQLLGKPRFEAIADAFTRFVSGATLVIHNARFDCAFLEDEFKRLGGVAFASLPHEIICTRVLARRTLPRQSVTLDALCDRFGIDRSRRTVHGGLLDCELLAEVYPPLAALHARHVADLRNILPYTPGEPLPSDVPSLGIAYLSISTLMGELEGEQKRIKERLSVQLRGKDFEHTDFRVQFGERIRTNWRQIVQRHLKDLNLQPFRKKVPMISIQST